MLIVRPLSPIEEHVSSSKTGYKYLLSKAKKALQRYIINKTNRIYTKQGLDLSKAFLSALYILPTKSFD